MDRRLGFLALFSALLGACGPTTTPVDKSEGLQEATAAPPLLLGEGVLSTELPEFATAFTPDGARVFFNRTSVDRGTIWLLNSTLQDGSWTEPVKLPFADEAFRDMDPFVSRSGDRLFVSSNRPWEGGEAKDFDLWVVDLAGEQWGELLPVEGPADDPINTEGHEIFSTLTRDGTLYFNRFSADWEEVGIYRARARGNAFEAAEKVILPAPAGAHLTNPSIAPDESFLVLSSADLGDQAEADLYVSYRQADGGWGELQRLEGGISSEHSDFAPHLSADGSTLYFTSERPGVVPLQGVEGRRPGDLYQVPFPRRAP